MSNEPGIDELDESVPAPTRGNQPVAVGVLTDRGLERLFERSGMTADQAAKAMALRAMCEQLAKTMRDYAPRGAFEATQAVHRLHESMTWAIAGIAR